MAIIPDGNGRWAASRGLPRTAGHRAGARAVRPVVEAAARAGVEVLSLYGFSADNWKRPRGEVDALMEIFERYLDSETPRLCHEGLKLNVIGRRDRLPASLRRAIERAEAASADGGGALLRIALDYSAREALVRAAASLAHASGGSIEGPTGARGFERALSEAIHSTLGAGDVDLVIRTGGENRLSDFLLWESAYAELYFTPVLWPDFTAANLERALADFGGRERRFGRLPELSLALGGSR